MLKHGKFSSLRRLFQRRFASQPPNIAIAAAVRIGKIQDISGTSKSSEVRTAVETIIKRAALPKDRIDGLHLVLPNRDIEVDSISSDFLPKNIKCTTFEDDLQAFQAAFEKVKSNNSKSIIVVGVEELPVSGTSNEAIHRLKTDLYGSYEAEVIPVSRAQKQRKMQTSMQDEKIRAEDIAIIISTTAFMPVDSSNDSNIKPLAHLMNSIFFHSKEGEQPARLIRQLFDESGLNFDDVDHWEIDSTASADALGLGQNCLHTNSISGLIHQSLKNAAALQFTHLANSLSPQKLGCAVLHSARDGSTGVFLLKNTNTSTCPPILTLFTKDPCPLCGMLMEELENNFINEYKLEKIFIDRKENVRFLRLFRHDIPVLFLNGQFLCMHRLDVKALRKKLDELKKI